MRPHAEPKAHVAGEIKGYDRHPAAPEIAEQADRIAVEEPGRGRQRQQCGGDRQDNQADPAKRP
jgi:hypothetical protein